MHHGLVLLILAALTAAYPPAAEPAESEDLLTGYSLTSWNDGDGRPLGSVHAIVQSGDGYLWVGSDAGLFRFDGSRFTPWDAMGDAPLPPAAVRALLADRDGSLWVGLADGRGIAHIRDGRLLASSALPDAERTVTHLAQDLDGTVWAVDNRALFRRRGDAWSRVTLPWKDREGFVLQPYVGSNGDLWVGTRWGVFRRAAKSDTFELLSNDYVFGISEDAGGRIWTTDIAAGFRRFDGPRGDAAGEGAGFKVMHDRKGNLWVATFGNGLWRLAPGARTRDVKRVTLRSGLFSDSVQSLAEDRDGNIWVGTTGGLHRLTERVLTPLENVGFVVAVEMGPDGRAWGATSNGVVRFSRAPTDEPPALVGFRGLDVRALYADPRGTMWAGTTDGLWRMDGGRLSPVPLASRPHMQVLSIAPNPNGGLLLGDGDWLFGWDGARLTPIELADARPARITVARTDSQRRVWLGLGGGGVAYVRPDGSFHRLGEAEGFDAGAHAAVSAIFEDAAGVVWIGGTAGLSRFEHGRVTTLPMRDALPGSRVWAIVEDAQQHLWLSVDRGVLRAAKADVARALADASYRLPYRLYDSLDGLAGAAVGIIGSVLAPDGTLWLVRGGGVTLVHPRQFAQLQPRAPAPVRIEAVVAGDRRLAPAAELSLGAGTSRLQISYTALTLTASNNIRFRYRLSGVDRGWTDAGSRRTAFYTNLAPGPYEFHVEATADDGAFYSSAAAWSFRIAPAFYQTWWFAVLAAVAAGLAVFSAWRVRLGLVKRQFALALAERMRLSREIHDTLLQSLVGIALQLDAVSVSVVPAVPKAGERLVQIRRRVETYIREARQSIWELRSPQLETRDLFTALREFGRSAVSDTPVRFAAETTGGSPSVPPMVQNQLLRIGQEAITNAVRHARATRIQLNLDFSGDLVTLRVRDDGQGFVDGQPDAETHYGLTTMRERAEELGGRLRIVTAAHQGTVVEAHVPLAPGSMTADVEAL